MSAIDCDNLWAIRPAWAEPATRGGSAARRGFDSSRRGRAGSSRRPAPPAVTPPVAMPASAATLRMLSELQAERQRAERMCDALSKYVPPQLVDRLMASPDGLSLGHETRDVTILFADIRGFTGIAEAMKGRPDQLADVVNAVLEPLADIVLAHGGVLDKYMGDCIMAFWGAPDSDPDHARRAFDAARGMIERMPAIDAEARAVAGRDVHLPRIDIGVGLNSGDCVVGNVGSRRRWDYSVLGDPVNVASRLQQLCKTYGRSLLAGEATARHLAGVVDLVEIDRTTVRGRCEPQGVYALDQAPAGRRAC
ncbi:adenylate/guanylate cyclase domain-containing protein [Phenylobacterium sp.]|uniref:adenylate/guanylate cyclase domain-containing protein n=1 Tax=Phenylobacterium sp. TaxID=1871053 RepID=UPI00301CC9F6